MDDAYVTNDAWHAHGARPDAIDDIADQFERPAPAGAWSERRPDDVRACVSRG